VPVWFSGQPVDARLTKPLFAVGRTSQSRDASSPNGPSVLMAAVTVGIPISVKPLLTIV